MGPTVRRRRLTNKKASNTGAGPPLLCGHELKPSTFFRAETIAWARQRRRSQRRAALVHSGRTKVMMIGLEVYSSGGHGCCWSHHAGIVCTAGLFAAPEGPETSKGLARSHLEQSKLWESIAEAIYGNREAHPSLTAPSRPRHHKRRMYSAPTRQTHVQYKNCVGVGACCLSFCVGSV